MTALTARNYVDGSKPDTPNGVNVGNFQLGLGNLWDVVQSLGGSGPTTVTSGVTALTQANCGLVLLDASAGNITVNLPTSASTPNGLFAFKRIDTTANTVTVNRAGADTIDGATSLSFVGQYDYEEIRADGGTAWRRSSMFANLARLRGLLAANDSPFRNALINGHMWEDVRNNGAAQTITAGAALAYTVDRWYAACTGANVTGQQVNAAAADGTKRYQFTGAVGVTGIQFGQRIESQNVLRHVLAGTATLSVKLTNSLLGVVSWAAYYANSADSFGTIASPTRTLIANGTFNVTNAEATYSTQISVPAAAKTGIEIVLSVGAQVSGTWVSGDVMLEPGAVPAASINFERPDKALNLLRCMRYAQPLAAAFDFEWNGLTSATNILPQPLPVPMRATPTVATQPTYGVATNISSPSWTALSDRLVRFTTTVSSNGYCRAQANSTGLLTSEL